MILKMPLQSILSSTYTTQRGALNIERVARRLRDP